MHTPPPSHRYAGLRGIAVGGTLHPAPPFEVPRTGSWSLVVHQFDQASITTIGILVGVMFLASGAQQFVPASVAESLRWLWALFGALFLIAGLVILAFWTSGQFFIEKAYTLLVFAGIWALMHGVGDIVRAFQLRSLRDAV